MVSRDAHLSDKPIKKFKQMPTGKVRIGISSTGRGGAGTGRATEKEPHEGPPSSVSWPARQGAVTTCLPSKNSLVMCGFVNLFYFIMEPKKFESILNKNMGEFKSRWENCDSISRGNKRKDKNFWNFHMAKNHKQNQDTLPGSICNLNHR